MSFISKLLLLILSFTQLAQASKPLSERSAAACESLLTAGRFLRVLPASSSTFIPLRRLLDSASCEHVPTLWRTGDMYSAESPSMGLVEMFRTAELAADDIIQALGIQAVTPKYDNANIAMGAAATVELIRSQDPPAYIRKAILMRPEDGIYVVVPLLKLVEKKSKKTGKPLYIPMVTKGHQELENNDIYSAAFAAWALERWIGQIPETAEIYLKPMVKKRVANPSLEEKAVYTVKVEQYLPIVRVIHSNFIKTAANPQAADTKPRRCTTCNTCPWAAHCRAQMKEAKDLSMIPLPPSKEEAKALRDLGYTDLDLLSKLDINSPEFIRVALTLGTSPYRLRYFVARALATAQGRVLVTKEFEDPLRDAKYIVHIDFEDVLAGELRSGVYLFGLEIQGKGKTVLRKDKEFVFAKNLNQQSIDEAWARFLRFLKKEPRLKSGRFLITTYSKHEAVKIEQEFDILKQPAKKFSPQQKSSPYYSEAEIEGEAKGEKIGRLIRNQSFFKKHKDITPEDVFMVLDKSVDLLVYVRRYLAIPGFTNTIKRVLDFASTPEEPLVYPPGSNGLESMAWAFVAYRTQEPDLIKRIEKYNELDIDANRLVANLLRGLADTPAAKKLVWDKGFEEIAADVSAAASAKRRILQLEEKQAILEGILGGKSLENLTQRQLEELLQILDRTDYLEARSKLEEEKLSDEEHDAKEQYLEFSVMNERKEQLTTFFKQFNPKLGEDPIDPQTQSLVQLLLKPSTYLTPLHIHQILMLGGLKLKMAKLKPSKDVMKAMKLPESLKKALREFTDENPSEEMETLWYGLYLSHAFPIGDLQ